jgi:TatA/E family protein of Tat protein translocase
VGFNHLPELFIILVLALIVFGPSRLPEVGSSIGKAMREFRRATSEIEDAVLHHGEDDEDEDETDFPHVPPEPDREALAGELPEPTIDTLASRREARQRAREATGEGTAKEDHAELPS